MLRSLFAFKNRAYVEVLECKTSMRDTATVAAVSAVYQKVFGGEPWNEGYFCPVCDAEYPLQHPRRSCEACSPEAEILLVEYWPRHRVVKDFYKEMRQPGARLYLAHSDEGIVGFAWGYDVEVTESTAGELDAPLLHHDLHGTHFYVDEVALLLPYRGKGIGKQLLSHLVEGKEIGRVFYRTLANSPMQHLGISLGGRVAQHISAARVVVII